LILGLSLFASTAAIGCATRPNEPIVVEPAASTGQQAFDDALSKARALGYTANEVDDGRLFASFVAKSGKFGIKGIVAGDALVLRNRNYLMIQVLDDNRLKAWAAGPDVRKGKVDRKLGRELDALVEQIGQRQDLAARVSDRPSAN
jgi:hypothetical protein